MGMSTGVAMEIHYCMGKKAGVDFFQTENERCGRCGMKEKKGGCCNDEHRFFKLSDAHKNVAADENSVIALPVFTPGYSVTIQQHKLPVSQKPAIAISPQRQTGPPIFIRNRVFRI